MNQNETIEHLSSNLNKVIASHGADSDHTAMAFYQLQAARIGLSGRALYDWAEAEMARAKDIALSLL